MEARKSRCACLSGGETPLPYTEWPEVVSNWLQGRMGSGPHGCSWACVM